MSQYNGTFIESVRQAAAALASRKFTPVPVRFGTKKPNLLDGWEQLRVEPIAQEHVRFDLDSHFPRHDRRNVGVSLGAASGGLIDIDLDSAEALAAAPILMPPTRMIWGRQSCPTGHRGYLVETPPAKAKTEFADPTNSKRGKHGGLLLELRSTGGQTVTPPSIYAADPEHGTPEESSVWHSNGEPAAVNLDDLRQSIHRTASAALIARHWPIGARHDASLAIAGGLLRAGWSAADVEQFLTAICVAAGDAEVEDRVRVVAGTKAKIDAGEKASGWPTAAKLLGDVIVGKVRNWLGVKMTGPTPTAGRPGQASGLSGVGSDSKPRYVPIPEFSPFPMDALPQVIREMATAVGEAMFCDPIYFIPHALTVAAGAIGRTRVIRLKRRGWREPAILWSGVIADSGGIKSPPYKKAIEPIETLEIEAYRTYKEAEQQYQCELRAYKAASRGGNDAGDPPTPPVRKRYCVGDVTVEKLARILDQSPDRILNCRDELAGWMGSFNAYKKQGGADRANWLQLHTLGTVQVDRVTGDVGLLVSEVGASICGTIQPGVLRRQMTEDNLDSGIMARMLLVYPPKQAKRWTDTDIPQDVEDAYHGMVRRLASLQPGDFDGRAVPIALSMTEDARKVWVEFFGRHAARQYAADGAYASALAKIEAYAARLALVHHICETIGADPDATTAVSAESLRAGVQMGEWFVHETQRVYCMLGDTKEDADIRRLVRLIERLAKKNGGTVKVRDVRRAHGEKYRTVEDVMVAFAQLVALGLGTWDEAKREFRPNPTPDKPDNDFDDDNWEDDGDSGTPPDSDPTSPDSRPWDTDGEGVAKNCRQSDCAGSPEDTSGDVSGLSGVGLDANSPNTGDSRPAAAQESSSDLSGRLSGDHSRSNAPTPPRMYRLITDVESLNLLAGDIAEAGTAVGIDTETASATGVADDALSPDRGRVRLLSVQFGGAVYLVDVFAFSDPTAALRPLFDSLAVVEVVGHNLKFDLAFLAKLGFVPGTVFDSMLASQVLHAGDRDDETNARLRHGLAAVAQRELAIVISKDEQTSDWGRKVLTPAQLAYAATDVRHLVPLAAKLREKLAAARLTETADREMRALLGIAWSQPVAVDSEAWSALAASAEAERDRLAEAMDKLAPNAGTFTSSRNWNAVADIIAAFKQVGIAVASTDDDTLAGIDHPLAAHLRDYRSAAKRAGTYGRRWLAEHAPTGFVRPSWNQMGASSGRMSCSDPNLQQVPRTDDYRRCFVARPGCVLIKADYSQIELRVAAVVACEDTMIAAYAEGRDLHTLTAAALTGKPVEQVAKADRQLAKAANFGLLYGMGYKSLGRYAASNYGVSLTDAEAKKYRDTFFRTYPKLADWHRRVEQRLKTAIRKDADAVLSEFTRGGRRKSLSASKKSADGRPYPNLNEFLNFPVQGTAADGMKSAIGLLWERRHECPRAVPTLFVHDEIVVECPEANADAAKAWLTSCMVDGMQALIPGVPAVVEATVGKTWGG